MKRLLTCATVILFLLLGIAPHARAQKVMWANQGVGVATSSNPNYLETNWSALSGVNYTWKNMNITPDGFGGVIMAWEEFSGTYQVFVQRLDCSGKLVWTTSAAGLQVASGDNGTYGPQCVTDGAGGAYVTYYIYPTTGGNIRVPYIQHFDANGSPLWGTNGYPLINSSSEMAYFPMAVPQMESDGNGGVVVSYYSWSTPSSSGSDKKGFVRAARMNGSGTSPNFVWGPVKVADYSSGSETYYPASTLYGTSYYAIPIICSDGGGGAFVAWQSTLSGQYRIHVSHINSSGAANNNVIDVESNPVDGNQGGFNIAPNGNGGATLIYCPTNWNGQDYASLVAGVASDGSLSWGPNPVGQYGEYYQQYGRIASDGNGGAYATYYDGWDWGGQTLVHYDNYGSQTFDWNGYPIYLNATGQYNFNDYQGYSQVMSDGMGNAICAWTENGNTVYIQKYKASDGSTMWGSSAVKVSTNGNSNYQTGPHIATDNAGGAFITWQTGNNTLYAQHVVDQNMAPQSKITPSSVAVGSTRLGTWSPTIANAAAVSDIAGQFPLTVSSAYCPDGNVQIVSPSFPVVLNNGQSAQLGIQVRAPKIGAWSDSILIGSNDPYSCGASGVVHISGVGVYPRFAFQNTFDSIHMNNVHVGTSLQRTLTVLNTAAATDTLHVTNATIPAGSDFSVISPPTPSTPLKIPPGSSATITVQYTASSNSPAIATLSIVTDDTINTKLNGTEAITLYGNGIYPHLSAQNTLEFPYTVVDVRSNSNILSVLNTIGTDTLFIYGSSNFTGANAAEFSDTGNVFPIAIPPGGSGGVKLTFNPIGNPGYRYATFNLVSNYDSIGCPSCTASYPVSLTGKGVPGAPEYIAANTLNAGNIKVKTQDTTLFTITNGPNATAYLIISEMLLQGPYANDFKILNMPKIPDTIKVGVTDTLKVQFYASQAGPIPATLHMITNAADYPFDVAIYGEGLQSFLVVNGLAFGNVGINQSDTLAFHMINYGTLPLKITSLTLLGSNASNYSVLDTNYHVTLQPGNIDTVRVSFHPTSTGPKGITARFITDAPDTAIATITGAGVYPGNLQTASVLDFGAIAIGNNMGRVMTIRNTGQTPTTITSAYITGAAPIQFTTTLLTPVTVQPGDSLTDTVWFSAMIGGPAADTLKMQTSDGFGVSVMLRAYASSNPYVVTPLILFNTSSIPGDEMSDSSVLIYNFTKNPLQISNIQIVKDKYSAYRITYPISWPRSIAPQAYDSVSVLFQPNNAGATMTYLAELHIVLNSDSTVIVALDGSTVPSEVRTAAAAPKAYTLGQNYPNPFNPRTEIAYGLPSRANVALTVYDQLGNAVAHLVNGEREAGSYAVSFNADALPAGIYYYELRANNFIQVRMMQLIK